MIASLKKKYKYFVAQIEIMKITIIGGGNLGTAMAEGLLKSKFCSAAEITITKRNTATLKDIAAKGVKVTADNLSAVKKADIIILAVKPFQIADVIKGFKDALTSKQIVVSVITGVSIDDLRGMIKKQLPVFRAMPNTAIISCCPANTFSITLRDIVSNFGNCLYRPSSFCLLPTTNVESKQHSRK